MAAGAVQFAPGIEDPVLIWTPSVTPSGLTRYHGKVYRLWDGDFFLGQLTAKALARLRIDGHRVILQESLLLDLQERIRDVKVGPDGHLYVLTDHQNGRVLRLRPGSPSANQLTRVARRLDQDFKMSGWDYPIGGEDDIASLQPADLEMGRRAFQERCAACHSVGAAVRGGEVGPDLAGVYGSLMGRRPDFAYSLNMADSLFEWKFATLDRFLSNPNGFVPGTKMAAPPVTDTLVRRQIIGFLKEQSPQ